MVALIKALLLLNVSEMGGVWWISLTPVRTFIHAVYDDMPSASNVVASGPSALTTIDIVSAAIYPYVVYSTVSQLAAMSFNTKSAPLAITPGLSWVGHLTHTPLLFHFRVFSHPLHSQQVN